MKHVLEVCLIVAGMIGIVVAQDPTKPELQKGIPVELPVASEAVAMPAADNLDATVVTVTAEGKVFLGLQPVEITALARMPASTVYVKADARAPYQQVLSVLGAVHDHSIVLLTAPTAKPTPGQIGPPCGVRLRVVDTGLD